MHRTNEEILRHLKEKMGLGPDRSTDPRFASLSGITLKRLGYWYTNGRKIPVQWVATLCESHGIDLNEAVFGQKNPLEQQLRARLEELYQENLELRVRLDKADKAYDIILGLRKFLLQLTGDPNYHVACVSRRAVARERLLRRRRRRILRGGMG